MQPEQYAGAIVAAGASLSLPGELDLGSQPGTVHRNVDVLLQDGRSAHADIVSDVFPTYTVSPDRVEFGRIEDLTRPEPIVISFRSETGARLLRVSADVPWLLLGLRRLNYCYEVVAALDPDLLPSGHSHGRIILHSDDMHRAVDYVACTVDYRSGFRVIPSRLVLRVGETREVVIVGADGQPAPISAIACVAPEVIGNISGSGRAALCLSQPLRTGYATIKVSIAGTKFVTIPVYMPNQEGARP